MPSPPVTARGKIGGEVVVKVRPPERPRLAADDPGWRLTPVDHRLRVDGVVPRSEAERAGVVPGDYIVAIRGMRPVGVDRVPMPVVVTLERPGSGRRRVSLPQR